MLAAVPPGCFSGGCLLPWLHFVKEVLSGSFASDYRWNQSLQVIDTKVKCAHQARLETRTKESNMLASRRVENLKA